MVYLINRIGSGEDMGSFALAMAVLGGTFVAGLTLDVGVNTLQNFYPEMYSDAFWSHKPGASPSLQRLAREEIEIDRLMRGQEFVIDRDRK